MSAEVPRVKENPIAKLRRVIARTSSIGLIGLALAAGTAITAVEVAKLMPTIPVSIREGRERYDKLKIQATELIKNNEPDGAVTILTSPKFLSAENDFQAVRLINSDDEHRSTRQLLTGTAFGCMVGTGICAMEILRKTVKFEYRR